MREPNSPISQTAPSIPYNNSAAEFMGNAASDGEIDEASINGAVEALGLDDEEYISARFSAGEANHEPGRNSAISMDTLKAAGYLGLPNPTTILMKFEAHENESHAVRWSPVERLVATGGADRKVKLWDIGKGNDYYYFCSIPTTILSTIFTTTNTYLCMSSVGSSEPRAVLSGSSAGINSVDFDSTGAYILGTSNDYGARVWTVMDSRLRVSTFSVP